MRRVLTFAARFAAAYALFVLLWLGVLEQRYNDYLAWSCSRILALVEEPRLTTSLKRQGNLLLVDHVPHFARVPRQRIVMRRVNSNTALFVALTVATPGVGWIARVCWLVGAGALLSASHTAHVLSFIHQHYALHNVGQYFTMVAAGELRNLGVGGLLERPAARKRAIALAAANVFNIVLQRVVPIVLWLPLLFAGLKRPAHTHAPSREAGRRRVQGAAAILAGAVALVVASIAVRHGGGSQPPGAIEGVRLGMGAVAARRVLERHGYAWTRGLERTREKQGALIAAASAWPRRGPLMSRRYGARYNWIGLEVAVPTGRRRGIFSGCVTAIKTAPSDSRPERYDVQAGNPVALCQNYWKSVKARD